MIKYKIMKKTNVNGLKETPKSTDVTTLENTTKDKPNQNPPKKRERKSKKELAEAAIQDSMIPINDKEISDFSFSDLLCFFPKSSKEIFAVSTIQNSYEISFNNESAIVCIDKENLNLTLKTVGVQITNKSNVVLVFRNNEGYGLKTNMAIDVPDYINVSKINRNPEFTDIVISNPTINISVNDNHFAFISENCTPQLNVTSPVSKSQTIQKPQETKQNLTDENEDYNLLEDNNTLIISEKDNQIVLPYTIDEATKAFEKNKKKYSSVEDLIKNEYIISADNFKNPIKSRFRESFQLIKKKEHGNFKEAIDLGLELMFQSNLNPAIIAACKSLKELDIYLDCLDDNEVENFSCFDIVYKVPPSLKKSKNG